MINEGLCTECGLCVRCCAGHGFSFYDHYLSQYGSLPEHPEVGCFEAIYSAYATDHALRWKCQSGGLVSALLIYLLEEGRVGGAVVTRWEPSNPLQAVPFIARTREDVLSAAGSKYCPVPVGSMIAEMLKSDETFAFVGTPCQVQSLRKAQTVIPELRRKVHLCLGLFCLNVFCLHFIEHMVRKIGLSPGDVRSFAFRSKVWRGWPCDMRIEAHCGLAYDIEGRLSRIAPRPLFSAWRCQLCVDKLNEFSDISFGDCRIARHYGAHTLEEASYGGNPGMSDVIARSPVGHGVVKEAEARGVIALSRSGWREVLESTKASEKKLGFSTFSKIAPVVGRGVPDYGVEYAASGEGLPKPGRGALERIVTLAVSAQYAAGAVLRRWRLYRWVLRRVPHRAMDCLNRVGGRWVRYRRLGGARLVAVYRGQGGTWSRGA